MFTKKSTQPVFVVRRVPGMITVFIGGFCAKFNLLYFLHQKLMVVYFVIQGL